MTKRPHQYTGITSIVLGLLLACPTDGHTRTVPVCGALPVNTVLSIRSLGDLTSLEFSPDGMWVAYVVNDNKAESEDAYRVSRTGIPVWAKGDDIYVSNTETRRSIDLTGGEGDNWLPSWSPNGRYLAFVSSRDRSGEPKIWMWDRSQNKLKKISDLIVRTDEIVWTPDSRRVLVTTVSPKASAGGHITHPWSSNSRSVRSPSVVLYESSGREKNGPDSGQSAPWTLNAYLRDLSCVIVATGTYRTLVQNQRIAAYKISNSGSRIALTIPERFEQPGSQQIVYDLATVTLGGRQRVIASGIHLDYDGAEFSWSPDDRFVAYHAGGQGEKIRDCYVVETDRGLARNITRFASEEKGRHYKASVPLWDSDGHVYFLRENALWRASVGSAVASLVAAIPAHTVLRLLSGPSRDLLWENSNHTSTVVVTRDDLGKENGFYRINLATGHTDKLLENNECFFCENLESPVTVSADRGGRVAYVAEDAQHAANLWVSNPSFRRPMRISDLNPQLKHWKMGASRLVSWLSDDGQRLHGALLLPANFQRGTRYPLIVWVYAGSLLSDHLDRFGLGGQGPFNFQLLASRGFAVFLPDSPQGEGEPMAELSKTVLPGVNKVIEMGVADPQRLGIMGQSNGGYSTLALLVQTTRFRAAVEMDGMASLVGLYGEMDTTGGAFGMSLEQGFDRMGGSLWDFRDRYIENSPIFYLDRVHTPLLIIHGAADGTVAPFLGDQIFVCLRRLGRKAEYAKYEGEGHSQLFWTRADQIDVCSRVIAWFEKYLAKPRGE